MNRKEKRISVRKVCLALGTVLLTAALVTVLLWQWNLSASEKKAQAFVHTLWELLPEPQDAVPEERRDNTMSVLSIDGTDFVGILEMPRYGSTLPVGAVWGESTQYPCRFTGSVYDGTLQIGATTQRGQYDFYRDLSVGDSVLYTDMEGNRYSFRIRTLRYEEHADSDSLSREEADLTLFLKNAYSFEYLLIVCDVS